MAAKLKIVHHHQLAQTKTCALNLPPVLIVLVVTASTTQSVAHIQTAKLPLSVSKLLMMVHLEIVEQHQLVKTWVCALIFALIQLVRDRDVALKLIAHLALSTLNACQNTLACNASALALVAKILTVKLQPPLIHVVLATLSALELLAVMIAGKTSVLLVAL